MPDLAGGMNLRDSVSMVQDNQLTDCVNMWFKDGVLKTRPGLNNMVHFENENWQYSDLKPHDIYNTIDGESCRLFSTHRETHIYFFWIGKSKFEELPAIEIGVSETEINYFVIKSNDIMYCFSVYGIRKLKEGNNEWEYVEGTEIYAPIITTNNLPLNDDGSNPSEATMLEGYNMLGCYYRMIFSTVDRNRDSNKMRYKLLYPLRDHDGNWDLEGCKVIAKIDYGTKVATHEVEVSLYPYSAENGYNAVDRLKMRLTGSVIEFYHEDDPSTVATVKNTDYIMNNMTVTAPYHKVATQEMLELSEYHGCLLEQKYKVTKMHNWTWFGGAAEGISGGTRLFLCGNSEEPNLVVWSDLNNPLYFPENNYFYAGDSGSAVTGFGKQADMLVIFKENETYYTQYQRNTGITNEDLTNQTVVDITASSVYFPLTLINPNIGCDCPDTVQLCRNRLVWVNSDGRVHTLVSNNQYNERSIFEIGEMIHRRLKTESDLKNACSADWNGYYLLQCENRIYVLDYNSYGYQYVSSYSKNEDANLKIPWHYWELDLQAGYVPSTVLAVVDGALLLAESGSYGIFKAEFDEESAYDHILLSDTSRNYKEISAPIKSELQTKLFEFGAQGYYKNVDRVVLSLGNNGGEPVNVCFVTDMGTEETEVTPDGEDTQPYSAGYIKSVQLNPCIRQVERFGVKLSCDGPLAVDGITLSYRVTGGVR